MSQSSPVGKACAPRNRQLILAVFGDIHGRIALMYALAILWERHVGIKLDGLLQVGDFGAFPDGAKLDAATKKHALKDADELGFQDFVTATPESQFYLQARQSPPTYFVRGNHEDFEYLGQFTQPTAIDPWDKIWFIPDNRVVKIGTEDRSVRVGAVGGIASRQEERSVRGKLARQKYRKAQKISNSEPRFFSETNIKNLPADLQHVDILMTHAGPQCAELPTGSVFLDRLAKHIQPRVHLFGHHHQVIYRSADLDCGLTVGLEHLEFDRHGRLKDGSWGILSISSASLSFQFMTPELLPILDRLSRTNYRTLV